MATRPCIMPFFGISRRRESARPAWGRPRYCDAYRFTPLALAIIEDQYKAAMALIESGAAIETPIGEAKLTPLMLTAGKEANRLTLTAGVSRVEKLNPA